MLRNWVWSVWSILTASCVSSFYFSCAFTYSCYSATCSFTCVRRMLCFWSSICSYCSCMCAWLNKFASLFCCAQLFCWIICEFRCEACAPTLCIYWDTCCCSMCFCWNTWLLLRQLLFMYLHLASQRRRLLHQKPLHDRILQHIWFVEVEDHTA